MDFEKAYDRIHSKYNWEELDQLKCDSNFVEMVQMALVNDLTRVNANGDLA